MSFLWFSLIGVLSGVFAGMGMGGGTFLIPLLTILMKVNQQVAQCVNLLVFIPLAIVVLIIYSKQKLLKLKGVFWLVVPATIVSILGSLLAIDICGKTLKIIFGIFLILVGIFMVISTIITSVKKSQIMWIVGCTYRIITTLFHINYFSFLY